MTLRERRQPAAAPREVPTTSRRRMQAAVPPEKSHSSNLPKARRELRPRSARRPEKRTADVDGELGAVPVAFRVRSATGAAIDAGMENLVAYSKRSWWQSFARQKESVVLALDRKTLMAEIRILNKNACAVDVSLAVENRPRSYIKIKRLQHMPHYREVTIKTGFLPCRFIKLDFYRHAHTDISVYGVQPRGVASDDLEAESGSSLNTVLSHTTEHLLYGPSLRASQPYMDCLSDHLSGSPEWMARHRVHLLDERIARLEAALFPLR